MTRLRSPRPSQGSLPGRKGSLPGRKEASLAHIDHPRVSRKTVAIKAGLFVLLGALLVGAVIGIVALLTGTFNETARKIVLTALAMAAFPTLSMPSLMHLEHKRFQFAAGLGSATAALALIMLLAIIWSVVYLDSEPFVKIFGTVGIMAFASNHLGLMLFITNGRRIVRACMGGTVLLLTVAASLLIVAIWAEIGADGFWRSMGTLLILDVLGTLGTPIVARIATQPRSA